VRGGAPASLRRCSTPTGLSHLTHCDRDSKLDILVVVLIYTLLASVLNSYTCIFFDLFEWQYLGVFVDFANPICEFVDFLGISWVVVASRT
jgi:hypothetical protein